MKKKDKPLGITNAGATNVPEEQLQAIESLIQMAQFPEAKKKIAKVRRLFKLGPEDRVRISDFLHRLGDVPSAFKMLSQVDDVEMDSRVLISQARLLNQIGAWKSALRKLHSLKPGHLPELNRIIAEIYLTLYEFEKGLPYAERLVHQEKEVSFYRHLLDQILLADLLEGLGKWKEAVRIVQEVQSKASHEQRVLMAICLQAGSEYLIKATQRDCFDQCERDISKALELFTQENATKDRAYALKWLGVLYLQIGRFEQAQAHLEEAYRLLTASRTRAAAIIEVLYWLREVRPLSLSEKMILNFYPLPSIWRPASEGNSVWIENGTVHSIFYEKTNSQMQWDLVADGSLSDQDLKVLVLILCTGNFGLSLYSLLDQVFESDFVDKSYGIKRLEFSLSKISRILSIERKENWITLKRIPESCVFPKIEWIEDRSFLRLKKLNSDFSIQDIEKVLKISKSTARRFREQWMLKYKIL